MGQGCYDCGVVPTRDLSIPPLPYCHGKVCFGCGSGCCGPLVGTPGLSTRADSASTVGTGLGRGRFCPINDGNASLWGLSVGRELELSQGGRFGGSLGAWFIGGIACEARPAAPKHPDLFY